MTKNILFYGNCQVYSVLKTLNLSQQHYKIFHVECFSTTINKQDFTNIISNCDIIITQPINDNYKDVDYLSTTYLIKNKKVGCKLILFDSCYFNFYYFDLTYKMFNNDVLHKPIDYHYNKMIEYYNNKRSVEDYNTFVINNIDLKTCEELETFAQNSLDELNNKHLKNIEKYKGYYIIGTHEYIKQNYKNKLLFYSMNHPTKYVIQFICEKIAEQLHFKNTIDYTIDYNIDVLEHTKCILYKCISKNVNFDINNHSALISSITDIKKITQLYYDTYKEIGLT
jgi:hypothetical protein